MNTSVHDLLEQLVGQQCCRQHVGNDRSLFLGFGSLVRMESALGDSVHGKWEIGTYNSCWRIVEGTTIVCGSRDFPDSVAELKHTVDRLKLGRFCRLEQITEFDVRVECDSGLYVDVLGTISDDDEFLHVFCPEKRVVTFSAADQWRVGPSDEPWK